MFSPKTVLCYILYRSTSCLSYPARHMQGLPPLACSCMATVQDRLP